MSGESEATDRVAKKPGSEARQGALQEMRAEKLGEDTEFAATILNLVQEAQAIAGSQSMSVGGDVRGRTTLPNGRARGTTRPDAALDFLGFRVVVVEPFSNERMRFVTRGDDA